MKQEWPIKQLRDVAHIGAGNPAPQEDHFFLDGSYPFIRTSDVGMIRLGEIFHAQDYLNSKGIKGLRIFPKGTILFPKSGASTFLNHRVMLGIEAYVASHLATIISNEALINPKFLLYYLTTIQAQDLVQDHNYPSLNLSVISEINIPTPSIPEQQRIVALLDLAFAAIDKVKENTKQNLKNAKEIFESQLDNIFRCENGWKTTTLSQVLAVQPRNGWSPPSIHHSDTGTPVLTLSSVTGFEFRSEKIKFTSARTDPKRHYWVRNGDFLITRSNTPELVGHVAIANNITIPTIYPDLIMRMTPATDLISTKFLYYQMRSSILRTEITNRAHGANPTMKKISKASVQSLPIVLPPLSKQEEIIAQLDILSKKTQELESIYQRKLIALEELKKSLLARAFSGEL